MTRLAVVLAAGRGTRMRETVGKVDLTPRQREAADLGLKGLVPVAGRPFLDHVLSAVADAGVGEVCLVTGPGDHPVRMRYEKMHPRRLDFRFAVQEEALGTAHALLQAEEVTGDHSFLLMNADNWYPPGAVERVGRVRGSALAGFRRGGLVRHGNMPSGRVRSYALVDADGEGRVRRVVEKPVPEEETSLGPGAWVSMTLWRFRPVIYEACRMTAPSERGERELPDAVQIAIEQLGETFLVVPCPDLGVLDLSRREDISSAAGHLEGGEVLL
ncbi:MAG: nucleotidyltransferase family protein [bacterium]